MAHLASFKAGGAAGVLKHDERKEGDKVEHRKNECIDPNRTAQNYNLAPARRGRLMEYIRRVCDDNNVRLSNRKDLNVMCSWIVTAPKTLQPVEIPRFFYSCYKFLNERYGEKYVLSATVHLDETTPHMHYSFIPVGYDDKNARFTVSSKRVATRTELQRFHKDLGAYMFEIFGRDIGIENGKTPKKGNRTIEEMKYETAVERTKKAEQAAEKAEQAVKQLSEKSRELTSEQKKLVQEVEALTNEKNRLEGQIEPLMAYFSTYDEIENLGKKKIGGKVVLSADEASFLKKQAQNYFAAIGEKDKIENENKRLKERYSGIDNRLDRASYEVADLKAENFRLNSAIESMKSIIQSNPELCKLYNQQVKKQSKIGFSKHRGPTLK